MTLEELRSQLRHLDARLDMVFVSCHQRSPCEVACACALRRFTPRANDRKKPVKDCKSPSFSILSLYYMVCNNNNYNNNSNGNNNKNNKWLTIIRSCESESYCIINPLEKIAPISTVAASAEP